MPNVDFRAMTARAVGPKWNSTSEEQKTRLISGFEALLLRTYAGAFTEMGSAPSTRAALMNWCEPLRKRRADEANLVGS